jgi:hypothetical protein
MKNLNVHVENRPYRLAHINLMEIAPGKLHQELDSSEQAVKVS